MQYDYYKILEIPRSASLDEIKRAYRLKAKLVHPDINNSVKATEVFAVVSEAYEVLMDGNKRYLHDITLNHIDAEKANAERKKQYYGSSVRNDSFKNRSPGFSDELQGFNNYAYKEKTELDYYRQSPLIYNMFFISGTIIGIIIVWIFTVGTLNNYWPLPFALIGITGLIIVREGLKGLMRKKSLLNGILKRLRK